MEKNKFSAIIVIKGPRMLPWVTLTDKKIYFIDQRLNQLRNVLNPHDNIDDYLEVLNRDDLEKVRQCAQRFTDFITIHCSQCKKLLFAGTEQQSRTVSFSCPDCNP